MWSPTHVLVTVRRACNLLTKGSHDTNDCFVTIALGKEKYQTSIKEKASPNVEWNEECELLIPTQGNTAEIVLTALHRNTLGVDQFLGTVRIPLAEFDVYERPKYRWYKLLSKPNKEKKEKKERGELEVRIAFTVKAGSLIDLSKKDKHNSSLGQLSHIAQNVGGSLLSIGTIEKRKGLKKFAKSIGSKVHLGRKKKEIMNDDDSVTGSISSLSNRRTGTLKNPFGTHSKQILGDADPGVVSEDEDEFTFDDLSHKSSCSSLNTHNFSTNANLSGSSMYDPQDRLTGKNSPPSKPPRASSLSTSSIVEEKPVDEWEQKIYGKHGKGGTLLAGSSDSLKRHSWESPLSVQLEENELEVSVPRPPDESTIVVEEEKNTSKITIAEKEDAKEKENRFSKKLKYFRKDNKQTEQIDSKTDKVPKSTIGERIIIAGVNESQIENSKIEKPAVKIPKELVQKLENKSREDLIAMIFELQTTVTGQKKKMRDMEDYLDELLLRVMETTPRLLQNPYGNGKMTSPKHT